MDTIGQCSISIELARFQWYRYHSETSLGNFVRGKNYFNVAVIKVS